MFLTLFKVSSLAELAEEHCNKKGTRHFNVPDEGISHAEAQIQHYSTCGFCNSQT